MTLPIHHDRTNPGTNTNNNDLLLSSRAAQRKKRLLEIEIEQRREDAEALKMTEEQRQTLLHSFTSVKAEFSDLDGLSWHLPSSSSQAREDSCSSQTKGPGSPTRAFVILTNADLASFSPQETIRASVASRPRPRLRSRSCFSSPNLASSPRIALVAKTSSGGLVSPKLPPSSSFPVPLPIPVPVSSTSPTSSSSTSTSALRSIFKKYKSFHARSPIKGLFANSPNGLYLPGNNTVVVTAGSDLESDEHFLGKSLQPQSQGRAHSFGRPRTTLTSPGPSTFSSSIIADEPSLVDSFPFRSPNIPRPGSLGIYCRDSH